MLSRLSRLFARPASPKKNARRSWCRPKVEVLEDRLAPATFVWTNGGGSGLFSNAGNWSNAATGAAGTPGTGAAGTPGTGDNLIFPLAAGVTPGTVTDDLAGTTNFASITFLSAGWTLAASAGSTVGITSAINDTTNIAGTNTITAGLSFAAATSRLGINVANPNGAATNLLNLIGNVNLGPAGFTFAGFGTLQSGVSAGNVISGSGSVVANGPGTFIMGSGGAWTGTTTINSGIVAANGAGTLGTGFVTVNNGGTLQLNGTGMTNFLTLNGFGFGGNGALTTTGNFTFAGSISLPTSSSINVGLGSAFTLVLTGGNISGPGRLTVVGSSGSQVTDQDAGDYGGTNVIGTTFALAGAGQNAVPTGYVVSEGGTLEVDNTTPLSSRLGPSAVELDGGTLLFVGSTPAAGENFGGLNFGNVNGGGVGSNTVNLGAGTNKVSSTALSRNPGSTVTFLGTNIGSTNTITFGNGSTLLVNGILPWADVGGTAPATEFATYNLNGNTGIGVAASTTFAAFGTAGGTGTENLKGSVPGGTLTLTGNIFVNSINFNGENINAAGFTITIASGGLLETSGTSAGISNGKLQFSTAANGTGPVEGILTTASGGGLQLTTTPILAGNNLTINGSPTGNVGGLVVNGNPAASTYTGTTWVTSGTVFLQATAAANVIPTPLVIGDDAGGAGADQVQVGTNFQQLGTSAAPDNVTINPGGLLTFGGFPVSQTIGNLTLNSGLTAATVSIPNATNALTLTGTVTSGDVALTPTNGLPGNAIPTVTGFQPSQITGTGTLILAPSSGTTTIFNIGKTPAVSNGGEIDLIVGTAISGSALLDKQGGGVLEISGHTSGYTGFVQVDGGTFAPGVANFVQNIIVDAGGTLGNDSVAGGSTAGVITVNSGTLNPGLPPSPLAPSNSQNGEYSTTLASTTNFSALGILDLHVDGYGTTTDWDQFNVNGLAVALGGTSLLDVDLLGLAEWGTLTGKVVNGVGASPFIWAHTLVGKFSNAPNATSNLLPAANIANNPTGFQAIVSYGPGFITLILAHPSTVTGSTYSTSQSTPLTVSSTANGLLAPGLVTNPDFGNAAGTANGIVSFAMLTTIQNPGTFTGSAGGTLVVNANGTFTYTPKAGFSGTETFSLTATDPRGTQSAAFTVTFDVTPVTPPPPPPVTMVFYYAVGSGEGIAAEVKVYNAATQALVYDLHPFGSFSGGVRVAVGDVNGDGVQDIVAGAGPGGGPQVVVFDGTSGQVIRSFYGLASGFTGGVFVAAGDINADGFADIIVGADAGGGPQIAVWSGKDGSLLQSFDALSPSFTGGVRVAAGDVNSDGRTDIVAAAGPGALSQVTVFSGANYSVLLSFIAFAQDFRGGSYVASGDLGGTGLAEIIVGAGAGGGPQVNTYLEQGGTLVLLAAEYAFNPDPTDVLTLDANEHSGVRVGVVTAPGHQALLTAPGPGPQAIVDVFSVATRSTIDSFFAFDPEYRGGVFV